MKTEKYNIKDVHYPEKNVRIHGSKQIEELQRSYNKFGQIRPVVVDEKGVILAGNGLVEALEGLGVEEVEVLPMKNLTQNDKTKLMIADNKIYNLGRDDNDAMFELLETLEGDYDVPGFDEETLQELLADLDDVDDNVMDYGKIEVDDREEFEKAGERLEERTSRAEERRAEQPEEGHVEVASAFRSVEEGSTPPEDDENSQGNVRKSVRCPHCNGTVWL